MKPGRKAIMMIRRLAMPWIKVVCALVGAGLLAACAPAQVVFSGPANDAETGDSVALRFAVLGDAEPKPDPVFPGVQAAVRDVNAMAKAGRIDFVVGVGDLAHDGTVIQYENVTPVLQQLTRPFYPIMGNEEHNTTVERFLDYAGLWNAEVTSPRYVQDRGPVVLVYASPDFGRDFNDEGIDWVRNQVRAAAPKPVFLVVHAAQAGVYPENPEKGVQNARFAEIVAEPNLAAVISGDLHMDMDRVVHSRQIGHVQYLHMPALERTKIPDETRHTPMFRVFAVTTGGEVQVDTYQTGVAEPLERLAYRFSLAPRVEPDSGSAASE
jgi:3',5'-cyclic-AMP phosphodiesterase